jgi:hypothetical protein
MAASPMAAFPVISILATVHLYRHFRAYDSARRASGAFPALIERRGQIAGRIIRFRNSNQFFRTERDAEFTTLAQFLIDYNFSLHLVPE